MTPTAYRPGVCDICEQEKQVRPDGNGITSSCADCRTPRTGAVAEQFVYRDVVTEAVIAACPDILHDEACAEVAERTVAELERLRVAVVEPGAVQQSESAALADGSELRDRTADSLGLTGSDEARWTAGASSEDADQPAEYDLRGALGLIERWCYGIARKAQAQGHDDLALTLPRVGEEIARALAGKPLAYANPSDPALADLAAVLEVLRSTSNAKPADDDEREDDDGADEGEGASPGVTLSTPLDRAAMWAHDLADVQAALAEFGFEPVDEFIGEALADQVRDALALQHEAGVASGAVEARAEITDVVAEVDSLAPWEPGDTLAVRVRKALDEAHAIGVETGEHNVADRITADVLGAAMFEVEPGELTDGWRETAEKLRDRLAERLGWTS